MIMLAYRIVKVKRSIQSNKDKPSQGKLQLSAGLFTAPSTLANQEKDAKSEENGNDTKSEGKSLFNFSNQATHGSGSLFG